MPEWQSLAADMDAKKIKHNNVNFSHVALEESALRDSKKDGATVNGEPVRGYPTIKISIEKNGNTKEFEYNGKRRKDEIISYLKVLASRELNN
jgi:hypothetical protein